MEKKKTGEFYAAKIVSTITLAAFKRLLRILKKAINNNFVTKNLTGKSYQVLKACHALLGEQTNPQTERQK